MNSQIDLHRMLENFDFEELPDRLYFAIGSDEKLTELASRDEAWELEGRDPKMEWMTAQDAVQHLVKCGCTRENCHTSDRRSTRLAIAIVSNPKVIARYGHRFDLLYSGVRSPHREGRKIIFAALEPAIAQKYGEVMELKSVTGIPFRSRARSVISDYEGDCDIEVIIPFSPAARGNS